MRNGQCRSAIAVHPLLGAYPIFWNSAGGCRRSFAVIPKEWDAPPLLAARHTEQQLNGLFADDGKEIDPVGGVVEGGKRDRVDGDVLVGVPGAPEAHAEDEQQKDPQVGAIVLYHGLGCAFLLRYRLAAGPCPAWAKNAIWWRANLPTIFDMI